MSNKYKSIIKLLSIASITALSLGLVATTPTTQAAGVVVTASPSVLAVSTATTVTLQFTTTAIIPVGGTVQVFRPTAGYSGTATLAVSAGAIGATTNTTSGSDTVSTATVTTAIPVGSLTITVTGLTSSATPGNRAFRVFTSAGDFGGAFQYVGSDNVVNVRARILTNLGFVIRNTADTADINECDLGDLVDTAVGICSYRLKVTTNAANGYTINVATTGNLTNGTYPFTNAAVGTGVAGGTNIVAGTEMYGAFITKGNVTGSGGTTTLANVYNAGATNSVSYVNTAPAVLLTATRGNAPASTDTVNTTLVEHRAAINGATPAGIYTQNITYTISPSF